jgi:hypothetical protein
LIFFDVSDSDIDMTIHEALVILESAELVHKAPRSEGGHGHRLYLECFYNALGDNAAAAGYTPKAFYNQWTAIFPRLERQGLIRIVAEPGCGLRRLSMTPAGRALLEKWDREGCQSHMSGRGASRNAKTRLCRATAIKARAA